MRQVLDLSFSTEMENGTEISVVSVSVDDPMMTVVLHYNDEIVPDAWFTSRLDSELRSAGVKFGYLLYMESAPGYMHYRIYDLDYDSYMKAADNLSIWN